MSVVGLTGLAMYERIRSSIAKPPTSTCWLVSVVGLATLCFKSHPSIHPPVWLVSVAGLTSRLPRRRPRLVSSVGLTNAAVQSEADQGWCPTWA